MDAVTESSKWPMTVIVPMDIYRFEDLDSIAQYRVAEWRMQDTLVNDVDEYSANMLIEQFGFSADELHEPSSIPYGQANSTGLNWQYDLSCSQGSGFNIYGDIAVESLINAGCSMTETGEASKLQNGDLDLVKSLVDEARPHAFHADANSRYTYSLWDGPSRSQDLVDHILDGLEDAGLIERDYGSAVEFECVWAEGSGRVPGSSLDMDGTIDAIGRVSEAACAGMDAICKELYDAAENQVDFYYTGDAYEDMYFDADGTFWGYGEDLEAAVERTERESRDSIVSAAVEATGMNAPGAEARPLEVDIDGR